MGLITFFLVMPIVFAIAALIGLVGGCLVTWIVLTLMGLFRSK